MTDPKAGFPACWADGGDPGWAIPGPAAQPPERARTLRVQTHSSLALFLSFALQGFFQIYPRLRVLRIQPDGFG